MTAWLHIVGFANFLKKVSMFNEHFPSFLFTPFTNARFKVACINLFDLRLVAVISNDLRAKGNIRQC